MTLERNKKKSIVIISVVAIILIAAVSIVFLMQSGNVDSLEHQLDLAYKYLSEGRYDEAIIAFDKVIGIDPKNIEARLGKIEAYTALGQPEKAEEIRREIIELGISPEEIKEHTLEFARKYSEAKEAYNASFASPDVPDNSPENNTAEADIPESGDTVENSNSNFYGPDPLILTDFNVVTCRDDGIYVRNFDSTHYEKVYSGYSSAIVTNGAVAYFIDNTDCYLKELNLYTRTVENLIEMPKYPNDDRSTAYILTCINDNLYFKDSSIYADNWDPCNYSFNLKTKECSEWYSENDFILDDVVGSYNNEVYCTPMGSWILSYPLVKWDLSGEPETVLDEGVNYTLIGNCIYYAVLDAEYISHDAPTYLSEVKILNLDSGDTETIIPKRYIDSYVCFFEKGFGTYDYETNEWYYETYDGEVVEMDGEVLRWTDNEVIYA